jgi:predicted acylesterase/phospholipase RssA
VLSGRGAEAAFEVGVVAGLASTSGFDAQILTGVSVGALNAVVLAGHDGDLARAAAKLKGIWLDRLAANAWTGRNGLYRSRGDVRAFLEPSRLPGAVADLFGDGSHWLRGAFHHGARMLRSSDDLALRFLWLVDLSSILSLSPLADLVREVVDLSRVRGSRRRLRIATADWVTGRVEIHEGTALDARTGHDRIVAAAARPGVFPCVEIDGAPQVDAAPFGASELRPAIDAGATDLHVPIFVATRGADDRPESTVDALDRVVAELQLARIERELAALRAQGVRPRAVHLYRGRLELARSHGFLDLSRDRIESLIGHGREVLSHHDCGASGCLVSAGPVAP